VTLIIGRVRRAEALVRCRNGVELDGPLGKKVPGIRSILSMWSGEDLEQSLRIDRSSIVPGVTRCWAVENQRHTNALLSRSPWTRSVVTTPRSPKKQWKSC